MAAHRQRVRDQMARLTDCLALIDAKVAAYEEHQGAGAAGDPWQSAQRSPARA